VTLTDVKLNRLVDFLQAVEAGPGIVKVKYLRLEPRPAQETVTAWLTVATYKLK
jgi:general secretion pathway protein M